MNGRRLGIAAIAALAATWLAFAPVPLFADTWYSSSWQYRQQITINMGLALSGPLSSFPVLVKITGVSPAGGNAVFSRAKTNGLDILFTAADGVTQLPHEIEKYDPAGQDLEAWVNVPSLTSAGVATIFMYYGNPGASSQQNPTGVWDSNYQLVLHLKEQAAAGQNSAIFSDSTANGNNGTQQGTGSASGQVAGGQLFNGVTFAGTGGNLINIDNVPTDTWSALTAETWFNFSGANSSSSIQRLFSKANGTGGGAAIMTLIIDNGAWAGHFTTRVVMNTTTAQYDDNPGLTMNGNISTGGWHHFAATWTSATNQIIIYLDGVPVPGGAFGTAGATLAPALGNQNLVLGNDWISATDRTFNGIMDETRFSHTVRSADWIKASYTNENNAAGFETTIQQVFISGTVYADEGLTPIAAGRTVALSINGGTTGGTSLFTTTTGPSGSYGIAVPTTDLAATNRLLAYLQGGPPFGAAVTVSNGSNLSGLDVYAGDVIVRNDNGGSPTVADMTTANNSVVDVTALYAKATGFLTNGTTLFVPAGTTFNPGASLNVGSSGTTASARIPGVLNASGTFHVFGSASGTGTLNGGASTVTIDGSLSVGTYNATNGTTTVGGDFAPASFTHNNGTVSFAGNGVVGTYTFFNLGIAGGTRTAAGNLTVSNGLTLTAGTFAPGSGTHLIAGSWNDSGVTFAPTGGTIQLTGAAPTITQGGANSFSSLTIGASTSASLGSAVTVQGNLSIQGTLSTGANPLTVGGNWSNVGTFNAGTGTVTFTNAALSSAFTGATTFNGFTCITPNKTLVFTAGSTQTVTGTLNLHGVAASLVNLVSSAPGSAWFFSVTSASPAAQFVDPQDSNAGGGNTITATNSIDGGANVNWTITPPAGSVVWTGANGTDWNTAANWNPGTSVPGPASNVTVPAGVPSMPSIASGASGSVATLIIQANASLTLAGTASLVVSGTFNNAGTVYLTTAATAPPSPGSGTFVYNGTGGAIPVMGYFNLTIDSVGQGFTLGNALVVNGNLVVNSGTLNAAGHGVTVSGGLVVNSSGILTAGTALSVAGSVSGSGVINGAGSTVAVGGSFAPGTYSASTATTTAGGAWAPGLFMHNNGTVTLTGTGTIAASSFFNLNENGAGSAAGDLTVANNLAVGGSLLAGSSSISVSGALSGAGTLNGGSGTVTVTGAFSVSTYVATSGLTYAGGAWSVGSFSPGPGTVIFNGTSTLASASVFTNLTIAGGSSLDTQGNTLTINGVFANVGTLFRRGNDQVSQTDAAEGTVQYRTTAGAIQAYPGTSYNNLVVSGGALTFTPAADLTVAGSVTIQAGATLDVTASNFSLTLGGNWTNSGIFTARNGTVSFTDVTQTSALTGNTTFFGLACITPGKTLQFTAGSNQTIATGGVFTVTGSNGTDVLLRGVTASTYTITLNGTATANVTYADVQFSIASPGITAFRSANSGSNTNWVFTGTSYTWNGATTAWTTGTNWTPNGVPGVNDAAVIPGGKSFYPLLAANLTVQALTIQSGGMLDIATREVTVNGTFINQGTLRRRPMANPISNLTTDSYFNQTDAASGGTVEYYGAGTYVQDYGSVDYANLTIDLGASITLNYNLMLADSLSIAGALSVGASNVQISLGGSWSNTGTFTQGTGTVYFLDSTQTSVISGTTAFYDLTCTVPGKTILVASASTQTIAAGGIFTITGAAGSPVTLGRSGGSGVNQWNITLTGTASVSFASVSNSLSSAAITTSSSINGGNDTNWIFPGAAGTYTWTGALGPAWNNQGNWNNGVSGFPNASTDTVTIPGGLSFFPAMDAAHTMANLAIQPGASLDTAGFTLTVTGTFTNQGTLFRRGGDGVNVTDRVEGTTWYRNAGGGVQDYGAGSDYFDLVLDAGFTYTLASGLATAQNLTINGTFSPGASSVSVGGALGGTGGFSGGSGTVGVNGAVSVASFTASSTFTTVGGSFTPAAFTHNSGSVTLTGGGGLSAGGVALAFNNLVIDAPGATVTLGGPISAAGSLTISQGTLDVALGLNYAITVGGNWADTGALTARAGTVTFNAAATVTAISGSTSFFNFTCTTPGKTLTFVAGTTQTVAGTLTLTGAVSNLITLQSTTTSPWSFALSAAQNVSFVSVSYSNANGSAITASLSANGGNNNANWIFASTSYTWNGGTSSAWTTVTNWTPNGVPGASDSVTIPQVVSGNYPLLAANTTVTNVTIQVNASVDTGGKNLTISGNYSNSGTLYRQGGDTVSKTDTAKGTIVYRTAGGALQTYGGPDYYRLEIDSGAMTLAANLVVNENLLVIGGSLLPGANQISVAGIWSVASGAAFTSGTGVVLLNGTGPQSISAGGTDANHAFNNLSINKTSGTAALGSAIQVNGNLNIQAGTLDAASGGNFPIGVATNWTNTGVFTPRAGTVAFNGAGAQGLTDATTIFSTVRLSKTGGTFTANNMLNAAALVGQAGAYNVVLAGGTVGGAAVTTFANTGSLTFGSPGFTFTSGVTATTPSTTLSGALVTSGGAVSLGPLALGANASIDTTNTGAAAAGGAIGVTSITGGGHTLGLRAGTGGAITATGNADNIPALTITSSNGTSFQGTYGGGTAGSVAINGTQPGQAVSFQGSTHITTLATVNAGFNVALTGAANTVDGATTFLNTGSVTLGQAGGTTTFTAGIVTTGSASNPTGVTLNGTITTSNAALVLGAITLGSDTTLNSTATTAAGTITVGAVTGAAHNLNLQTGAGVAANITATSTTNVGTLTVQSMGGTATFSGAVSGAAISVPNTVVNVAMTGATGTVTGASSFANSGTLSLGSAGGTLAYNGGITTSAVGGPVTLSGTITTSNAALVLGAITLGSDVTLNSTATTAAGTITMGAVTGAVHNLSLQTGAGVAANITATSTTNVGTLTVQSMGGTATFSGAVSGAAISVPNTAVNVAMTGATGTITGASSFANSGTLTLGSAGGTLAYNGGITTSAVGGVVTLNGTITTSNAALVLGAITLGSDVTLNSTATTAAGTITLGAVTGAVHNLSLQTGAGVAANITATSTTNVGTLTVQSMGGTATFSGAVSATALSVGASVVGFVSTGTGGSITNPVVFANTGILTLGQALGSQTYTGGLTTSGAGGPVTLNGTISTSNTALVLGAITLGSDTTLNSTATTAAGTITMGAVTGAAHNLSLQTGAGVAANITATSTTNVGTLTVQSMGGTATFSGAVSGAAISVPNTAVNVAMTGATGTITGASSFANSGTLTLGSAGGTLAYNGGITTSAVGGVVTLNGTITTSNTALVLGAITLGSDVTLNSTATTAAGTITLGAVTGAAHNLSLQTGAGVAANITATSTTNVGTLTVQSMGGTATFSGAVSATALSVGASVVGFVSTGTGGSITNPVVFANTGILTLGQALGSQTYTGGLTTSGAGGPVTLNGTITTSNAALVLGAITLGSDTTLSSTATTAAGTITMGAVTGAAHNLTLQTGAGIAANITATSTSGVGTLTVQSMGGTATFSGAVSGAAISVPNTAVNVAMTALTGTITGASSFANSGTLTLGSAGATLAYNGGITTSAVGGVVTLNGTITTSNTALVLGAITLGSDTTLNSTATTAAGTITMGAVTGAAHNLSLQTGAGVAANITATSTTNVGTLTVQSMGGTATFSGAVSGAAISVPNTAVNVAMTGATGTITGASSFANSGTLTLGQSGGTLAYNGGITTSAVGGVVTLNGTITTSNTALVLGAITLGSDTTLNSTATTAAGTITMGAVTGAAHNLTLQTGAGVAANITATSTANVGTLTVQSMGGTATFSGAVSATALSVGASVVDFVSTGTGGSITNPVVFANTGILTLGQALGSQTYTGGLTTSGAGGPVTLNGTITTSNTALVLGAITLGSDVTLNSTATTAAGTITMGAVTGAAHNLTLQTGAGVAANITATSTTNVGTLTVQSMGGTATFSGAVSGAAISVPNTAVNVAMTALTGTITGASSFANSGTLTLGSAGGTLAYNGGITTSAVGGPVTLNGTITTTNAAANLGAAAVSLASATTISAGNGAVTLGGTVNGGVALTLSTSGAISFGGVVGGVTPPASLTITTGTASLAGHNLSVSGALSGTGTLTATASELVSVGGDFTPAAFNASSSMVSLTGASAANVANVGGLTFYNLTVNKTTGVAVTLLGSIIVNNDVDIVSGTLDGSSRTISVARNWSNSDTYSPGAAGTVDFITAATSTIAGSTTFQNFTCAEFTTGKTIQFTAGTTQTINGAFTITGAITRIINLVNFGAGTWTLTPNGTSSVVYALVRNSTVTANVITASTSRDDGGNTIAPPAPGWTFTTTSVTWSVNAPSTDWSSGPNWDRGYVPNAADTVTIVPSVTLNQPALTQNVTVVSLTINAGATVSTSTHNLTLTGDLTASGAGAQLTAGGAETITVSGNVSFSGGAVFSAAGSTVSLQGGAATLTAPPAQAAFNNLTVSKSTSGTTLTLGSAVTVNGALSLTTGTILVNGQTLTLGSPLNLSSAAGTLHLNAASSALAMGANSLTVSAGTLQQDAGATIGVTAGALTVSGTGTYTAAGAGTITIGAGGITETGGSLSLGAAAVSSAGSVSITAGAFSEGSSTLSMTGAGTSVRVTPADKLYDLTINTAGSVTISTDDLIVSHNLLITAGSFSTNARNLTMGVSPGAAGAGNITAGAGVNPKLVTTAAETVTVFGSIDFSAAGNNLTQAAGSTISLQGGVNTTLSAPQEGFGSLTVSKSTLATTVSLTGAVTVSGALAVTTGTILVNGQTLTLGSPLNLSSAAGTLHLNAASSALAMGANSLTVSAGTLQQDAGATIGVTAGTLTVNGTGSYTAAGAGTITIGAGGITETGGSLSLGAAAVSSAGSVSITAGTFSEGSSGLSMTGAGTSVRVTPADKLYDLTINTAGSVTISTDDLIVSHNLLITAGSFSTNTRNLTVSGMATVDGTLTGSASPRQIIVTGNTTVAGTLNLSGGAYTTNNLTVSGVGPANGLVASGSEIITVKGSLDFSAAGTNYTRATSTIVMAGTSTPVTLNAPQATDPFYNLTVNKGGVLGNTVSLSSDITVTNTVTLTSGTLSAGSSRIHMNGSLWDDAGNKPLLSPQASAFDPGSGEVIFAPTSTTVTIRGDNQWYDFTCTVPGTTISFEHLQTQTITNAPGPGGSLHVVGAAAQLILLQSDAPSTTAHAPTPPDLDGQWIITNSSGVAPTIDYVNVSYSYAWPPSITPGPNSVDGGHNFNWNFFIAIVASWTLDTNNSGRIDGIRVKVQPGTPLSNDFSGFSVYVTGYGTISGASGFAARAGDVFDILLPEGTQEDTGATPTWRVVANTGSLHSNAGGALVDPTPTKMYTAADGARPVITFTSAALGSNKVYVHFSELVYGDPGATTRIGVASLTSSLGAVTVQPVELTGNGAHAAIVTLPIAGLASAQILSATPETIQAVPNTIYGAAAAIDPGTFANTNLDNNLPANALRSMLTPASTPAAPAHNITDVGIGFATPVFALNRTVARDPARGGVGMVTSFDGTHWLLPQDVLLEAKILVPSLLPAATLSVFWDVNPPASIAFDNLWIPSPASTFWSPVLNPGGDRAHNPNSEASSAAAAAVNGALTDFTIPGTDAKVRDGALLQFMFVLTSGAVKLPLAYQADPNNPGSVRPFEYSYHSIIAQRGNVTITNNVIHPANGETAYLHYVMPKTGKISITVFTLSGDIVNVLASGTQDAGEYATAWDGRNRGGRIVARGIYFIRAVGPGFDEMRKVLVVR